MIRVNLLAAERERVKRRAGLPAGQKITLGCSLILVAAGVAVLWWWWALDREATRLASETVAAEREAARLKTLLAQVDQFETRKQQLQQRVALIEELRRGQTAPVRMLDELSKALPEMLWLSELRQEGHDLTIDGRCTTLTGLSDFVGNLERSGYFRRPVEILNSEVETAPPPAGELIRFTMKAAFTMPGLPAPPPPPGRAPARR